MDGVEGTKEGRKEDGGVPLDVTGAARGMETGVETEEGGVEDSTVVLEELVDDADQ